MNIPEEFLTNQTFDSRAIGFNRQLLPQMIMGGQYGDTNIGYKVYPAFDAYRTDIIAAIELGDRDRLVAFCQGIQKGSPVDSFVAPEPWDMPGYESEVIMAAGAFTLGASIELSADAPLREPFAVWLQGGLTYNTGKMGILYAAQEMAKRSVL